MDAVMRLSELLTGLVAVPAGADAAISGLTLDSRAVGRGDVFVALAGARTHGLHHASAALAAGAVAVLFEPPWPPECTPVEAAFAVPGLRAALGMLAHRFYSEPSRALTMVGVTGTNGKTSTVQLLAQALSGEGQTVGTIGTLGTGLYGALAPGERTTPDVIALHRTLAALRAEGATHVAMEVSSHALDQGRVDAVHFDVAVFTNLTRDHLDYHGTFEAYGAAKAKLFSWPGLGTAVINLDDAFGRSLHSRLRPAEVTRIGVSARGFEEALLRAERVRLSPAGIAFDLVGGGARIPLRSALLGRFNVDNLMAVAGCLYSFGWDHARIAQRLSELVPVAGRMNRLGGHDGKPLVVVDYAHTPDALGQALASLREHLQGQLTCVFGCGGERDRGKRPQMGAVAESLAERVIVTDDNPRSEDADAIVAEILAGCERPQLVRVRRDRADAIHAALAEARAGDIVLIAGKGHETYQEIAGLRQPFDDMAVAFAALEEYA